MILQNNPYCPLATGEEYKDILWRIKKKGMKTYYDTVLNTEHSALYFPRFKNRDAVQKLAASMPDDQARRECKVITLEDMKCIVNDQPPITYCSRDIIKGMIRLMWQPPYAEHLINAA